MGFYMLPGFIQALLSAAAIFAAYRLMGPMSDSGIVSVIDEKYDYIIVGAGTSGCVLANRLTEEEDEKVLLIEAGGEETDNAEVDVPMYTDRVRGSSMDWKYKTVPQTQCCKGHIDQTLIWTSGKGLGGSSNLNYLQYLRGSRHDYDGWAAQGAQGWAFKDVLPYFIKSEDNRNSDYVRKSVFHGFGGVLTVKDMILTPVTKIMTEAFRELGIKRRDVNGRNQYGYAHTQATVRGGVRWSTAKAFLRTRAIYRSNLNVAIHSFAHKVIFEGKKAVGVQYERGGKYYIVRANKEVILTAGTIGSAKMLMLSGIGPKKHLESLKINVVADLPVGNNLQDSVITDGVEFFTEDPVSLTPAKAENFLSSWAYTIWGGGMKQSPRAREGNAFIRSKLQTENQKYPAVQLSVVANVGVHNAERLNIKDDVWFSLHGESIGREGFTIFPILLHPRSKGTVRLQSVNPYDPPLIQPNYLADPWDVNVLVEAIEYTRKIINTTALQRVGGSLSNATLPECSSHGAYTTAYWECIVRHITIPALSPVGTCKMGAANDPSAVVDPNLKVRGIRNLRVVDASVFPTTLSGNTFAPQIMLGEKAGDIMKDKNSVQKIKDYFKHLLSIKHEKVREHDTDAEAKAEEEKDKRYKKKVVKVDTKADTGRSTKDGKKESVKSNGKSKTQGPKK